MTTTDNEAKKKAAKPGKRLSTFMSIRNEWLQRFTENLADYSNLLLPLADFRLYFF